MNISPVLIHQNIQKKASIFKGKDAVIPSSVKCLQAAYPQNYYLLTFGARVEKDLDSFADRNKDRLPASLMAYIENLPPEERKELTPLQAQHNAFEYLLICDSVNDVKEAYPNEPLFVDLKEVEELKSKRGILYDILLMKDDLSGESLFSNGENNLTLYLLRKIFLEGKTIPEINNDINEDINEAFKKDDKNYILSSTLDALGIKLPSSAYLTSLRYTREGYSDFMADKISKKWQEMSPEERQRIISSHSSQLMSDEQKERLSQFSKERWAKMSGEEKVEAINAMQKGSQRKRIIMIDAWNNSPEARNKLSVYLRENNFYSPQSIIYKTDDYSPAMKIIMSKFWAANPELAEQLGVQISLSYEKYDKAEQDGELQEFIDSANKRSAEIKKEIKQSLKVSKAAALKVSPVDEYRTMFSFLPKKLLEKQCEILSKMSNSDVKLWIKYCMGQKLDTESVVRAEVICEIVAPEKSYVMQHLIAASINMLEGCLAPIVNPNAGEKFAPIFPTNLDFRFPDITRMYFNLRQQGYQKFKLIDSKSLSGKKAENVAKDFLNERFTKEVVARNPDVKFDFDLMNYKYTFAKQPDFELLNSLYEEICAYSITQEQAFEGANLICSDDTDEAIVEIIANSICANPHIHYSHFSNNSSDGMKLRTSGGINRFMKEKWGVRAKSYEDNLVNYEKRFIDFFSIKE